MVELPAETIWRFEDHLGIQLAESRLRIAQLGYSRRSTMVSYFLRTDGGRPWLESYELHASYSGESARNGDPEVEKTYLRNSYGILPGSESRHWVAESTGQQIAEEDFYRMALYAQPDRLLSLQQISFSTAGGQYLLELNLESKLLVLIGFGEDIRRPGLLVDMLLPEELSRSSYLLSLLEGNGGLLVP